MTRPLLIADLFCGAGGSSTGARRAIEAMGRQMILVCVNHWARAIETHSRMHPTARHYCQDVSTVKPREVVPEGYLDVLMASPTCTYHSRARGGKPTSDQQRQYPWLIIQWLTDLRVKRLIIENVPEFVDWGPVDMRTGKPMKSRKGEYFRAWVAALEALGFRVEWRILNCADYGDATTRRRFFLLARSDGRRIVWPTATHSKTGKADMFGEGALRWRAAREIIDWSQPGQSIFTRKRPLAPKTIQRIYAGAVKMRWPEPFIVVLRNHMDARGIDAPLQTLTTAKGGELAMAQPFVFPVNQGHDRMRGHRGVEEPVPTLLTRESLGLTEPGQHYDILFRMLDWRELARAMSFSDEDQEYEFAGTKTEITKQIGNAVPVRTARALVTASFHDLIPQQHRSAA